jgi:hypothetical protein
MHPTLTGTCPYTGILYRHVVIVLFLRSMSLLNDIENVREERTDDLFSEQSKFYYAAAKMIRWIHS